MLWYLLIFVFITLSLFFASIWMIKIRQRREIDSDYDKKITRIEKKTDPIYNFFYNLVGWVLTLLIFYYVYLRLGG